MTNESSGASKPSGMSNFQWLLIVVIVAAVAVFTKPDDESFVRKVGEDIIADGSCSIGSVEVCGPMALASVGQERNDFVVAKVYALINDSQNRMVYVGAFNTWFRIQN